MIVHYVVFEAVLPNGTVKRLTANMATPGPMTPENLSDMVDTAKQSLPIGSGVQVTFIYTFPKSEA